MDDKTRDLLRTRIEQICVEDLSDEQLEGIGRVLDGRLPWWKFNGRLGGFEAVGGSEADPEVEAYFKDRQFRWTPVAPSGPGNGWKFIRSGSAVFGGMMFGAIAGETFFRQAAAGSMLFGLIAVAVVVPWIYREADG